jgi:4-amino-4-deoxychorismate lyase
VGGIVLDPAMMAIPIDDHMVHRGHGVFDTAMVMDGCLYELDAHLARFLRSAAKARIQPLPPHDKLRSILLQMTAGGPSATGSAPAPATSSSPLPLLLPRSTAW